MTFTWQYPEDPIAEGEVTFGAEFKRRGQREISIQHGDSPITRIPVAEAICDACNVEVQDLDPCVIALHRLYCWDCAKRWVLPYVVRT